ncbi:MAG: UDP-N-acetylmuramoyl-tripeptide--D-alanyl-D-alanine ligase, partial [Sedimentisphaerales bacterium]
MKKFLIADLAGIIKAHEPHATGHEPRFFTGVSIDSRNITAGDCFFAVPGSNFDGHNYVTEAFAKGAVCAVISRDIDSGGNCLLKVTDTIKALGDFAAEYRRMMNFKVVAITGSVGKTMTRQITYHILSRHFRATTALKNFNNNIGLPLTLLRAGPQDEVVVAELGSNHPGEIAQLTQIAQPDVAVVTNAYPAHLEGFGDLETIVQEKLSISEGLRTGGAFIINGDCDVLFETCRSKGIKFTSFGKSSRCDVQAQNITHTDTGCRFTLQGREVFLPLLGIGNVENALAAWAVCSRFGINIDDFADAAKTLRAIDMRAELLQIGNVTLLSDCYNANPASMKNALSILSDLGAGGNGRLVFICGDMAELGRQTKALHAELGAAVVQAKIRLLLTVGKSAKIVAQTAKNTAKYDLQTKSFTDTFSACNNLKKFIKDYDIVLV